MNELQHTAILDEEDAREERHERWRTYLPLALIMLGGVIVALWVGYSISESQKEQVKAKTTAVKAIDAADQAQAEKYTLAQQVAAACAGGTLDPEIQTQLCSDARQVVKEGPQGAQGIPGIQGVQGVKGEQGIPGKNGADGAPGPKGDTGASGVNGKDGLPGEKGDVGAVGEKGETGATGPQGPPGPKGDTGGIGPQGPPGKDGQPPVSWTVENADGSTTNCNRADDWTLAVPTYSCVQQGTP
jgi:hypothetical protein